MNFFYTINVNDRYRFPILLNDWRKEDKEQLLQDFDEESLAHEYETQKVDEVQTKFNVEPEGVLSTY